MATRHQVRESVVSLLYAQDIGNTDIDKYVDELLEDRKIRNNQKEFALSLFNGVREDAPRIDAILTQRLKEWELSDLGHIERAILRLATYELIHAQLDKPVIINEAVELAKELGSDGAPKFINGVLDSISKESM